MYMRDQVPNCLFTCIAYKCMTKNSVRETIAETVERQDERKYHYTELYAHIYNNPMQSQTKAESNTK